MITYSRSTLVGNPARGSTMTAPYIPEAMCSQDHRRTAVIHEDARVVQRELELDSLPRRDGSVLVLRRHHGRVEIHRMHHRRRRHAYAGYGLVAAIRHREADLVADAGADRWSRHLIAEGPAGELHARR